MANPTKYSHDYSFTDWQANNPTAQPPGIQLDVQFDDIESSIDEIVDAVNQVRRSDGAIQNGCVTVDSLSSELKQLIVLTGSTLRGSWMTATDYAVSDFVQQGGSNYLCAVAHTSGVFATDLAAGKWLGQASVSAAIVSFTPTGSLSANNVQNALAELDSDLTAEALLRQNSDSTLSAAILAESVARAAADTALSSTITTLSNTVSANDWVTTARILDGNVTANKLASTLDLSGKTVAVATAAPGDNDTSAASTAFVTAALAAGLASAASTGNLTLTAATPGNLAVTYSARAYYAYKLGDFVIVNYDITTSAFTYTTATGNLLITGLPFTSGASIAVFGNCFFSGMTKANYTQVNPSVGGGSNQMTLVASGSGQAAATLAITDFPTAGTVVLRGTLVYKV